MWAPPVIQVVVPPATAIGAQPRPMVQGLRPPTGENDRCAKHQESRNQIATSNTMIMKPQSGT